MDRLQFLGSEVTEPKWWPSRLDAFRRLYRVEIALGTVRRMLGTKDDTDVSDLRRAQVPPQVIVGIRRAKQLPDSDPAVFTEVHEPPVNFGFELTLYIADST
jgi:hypothetical protein